LLLLLTVQELFLWKERSLVILYQILRGYSLHKLWIASRGGTSTLRLLLLLSAVLLFLHPLLSVSNERIDTFES